MATHRVVCSSCSGLRDASLCLSQLIQSLAARLVCFVRSSLLRILGACGLLGAGACDPAAQSLRPRPQLCPEPFAPPQTTGPFQSESSSSFSHHHHARLQRGSLTRHRLVFVENKDLEHILVVTFELLAQIRFTVTPTTTASDPDIMVSTFQVAALTSGRLSATYTAWTLTPWLTVVAFS